MFGPKSRPRAMSTQVLAAGAVCSALVLFGSVAVAVGNPNVTGGGATSHTPRPTSAITRVPDLANRLRGLKLINYFPRNHSWRGMWTSWQPRTLAKDFVMIRRLNANAVRITVFPDTFGYPQPTPLMQSRLADLVKIAAHAGLKVQLSIFDQFDDWADVSGSEQWARCLLAPYADDPRIAFIDLHNELIQTIHNR